MVYSQFCLRIFLLIGCFLGIALSGFAQQDSTREFGVVQPQYQSFQKQAVDDLKANDTYTYPPRDAPRQMSLWDRFKQWLASLFEVDPNSAWWEYGLYIAIFVILLFTIIKLLGIRFSGVLKSPQKASPLAFSAGVEDLNILNFEIEISDALANKNYALVVRLRYLNALHILAKADLVQVKNGKTNYDYLYELKSGVIKDNFSALARLFDYIWYGEFEANQSHSAQSEDLLSSVKETQKSISHA